MAPIGFYRRSLVVTQSQLDALVDEAVKGGQNAYIPYSQYRVGAACV